MYMQRSTSSFIHKLRYGAERIEIVGVAQLLKRKSSLSRSSTLGIGGMMSKIALLSLGPTDYSNRLSQLHAHVALYQQLLPQAEIWTGTYSDCWSRFLKRKLSLFCSSTIGISGMISKIALLSLGPTDSTNRVQQLHVHVALYQQLHPQAEIWSGTY